MAGISNTNFVCWEWQRDDGGYSPYPPEQSSELEASHKVGASQHTLAQYNINFRNMTQQRHGVYGTRRVRRITGIIQSTPISAYWIWSDQPGNFVPYQIEASVDIELGYQKHSHLLNLSKCPSGLPYTINFKHMNQTRHHYNTKRDIRRVQLLPGQTLQSLLQLTGPSLSNASSLSGLASGTTYPTSTPLASYGSGHGATSVFPSAPTSLSVATGGYGLPGHLSSIHTPYSSVSATLLNHTPSHPSYTHTTGYPSNTRSHPSSLGPTPSGGHSTKSGHNSSVTASGRAPTVSASTTSHSSTTASRSKPKSHSSKSAAKPSASKSSRKGRGRPRKEHQDSGASNTVENVFSLYARKKNHLKAKHKEEPCPICMNKLHEPSGFEDDDDDSLANAAPSSATSTLDVYKLRKCGHMLHRSCLTMYIKNSTKGGFQCPTCKKSYGVKMGDMPDGSMTVREGRYSLPGHGEHNTIEITYSFSPGYHNGRHFRANGFPRTCYLPNSPKGQKVLKLLKEAWNRKLTFTIGTSVTTGAMDTVVWNEIHHKTENSSNYSGHGYPDPLYLDRVLLELAAQGVEDGQQEEDEEDNDDSSSSDEEDEQSNVITILSDSDESL